MNDELTVLAQAGAAALVTAMATDAWLETRGAITGLFRRGRRAALEAQLDGNAELVRDSPSPDDVRRALFGYWTQELAALLREDPSCRDPLVRLVDAFDAADGTLAEGRRAHALRQTNTARDSATVFAVQHGSQHIHGREAGPAES
ncbi:hypothetical protein SAMN04487981_110309 [Streptomyces sp. cf386]|uniref:hypothetical protein n=1 Tax=Streptomyces sp. cf386 TaxID=1761904 RepID=UPI00088C759B|nr:hypothetical protein [Streptomyces sp. cf386]SDO42049.1 hypothetical protein SAMN04487981_110309 [Streptomyces sp. cf386]